MTKGWGPFLVTSRMGSAEQSRLRKAFHQGKVVKLAHGIYTDRQHWSGLWPSERFRLRTLAVGASNPKAVLCGKAAAAALNLPIETGFRDVPVELGRRTTARHRSTGRVRVGSLMCERSVPAIALSTATRHSEHGLEFAVAHPVFAAFTLAAWHSVEDAVVAIEAALRTGTMTTDSLRRAADITLAGCKGIARFRQALRLSNRHSESPRESGLKVKLWRAGLPPPLQQAQVYSKAGGFIARPDFLFDDASSLIVEYDGRGKYRGADGGENAAATLGPGVHDPAYTFDALNSERDREKMLLNQGFRVLRVYGDIYDDPQTVWDIAAAHGGAGAQARWQGHPHAQRQAGEFRQWELVVGGYRAWV